jgi:hypothetical protein
MIIPMCDEVHCAPGARDRLTGDLHVTGDLHKPGTGFSRVEQHPGAKIQTNAPSKSARGA